MMVGGVLVKRPSCRGLMLLILLASHRGDCALTNAPES